QPAWDVSGGAAPVNGTARAPAPRYLIARAAQWAPCRQECNMRNFLLAGAVSAFALASAAHAQDADYDASTVLARVNGTEITLGHVLMLRGSLPEQYQQLPDEMLLPGLVEQLVDQTLLAQGVSD